MTSETRMLVRKISERYLKTVTEEMGICDKYPVNVSDIIKYLHGNIIEYEDEGSSDGYIKYTNQENPPSFEICLKKIANEARRRFTLAHELGHLILHMDFLDKEARKGYDESYYRTIKNYTEKELQADEFAASFLMPSQEFIRIASENMLNYGSEYDVVSIASHFGVSKLAVITRGRFLGLFSWKI